MNRHPVLHDLLVCLQAPTQSWSGLDGQIRSHGAQGVYQGDVRVLSQARLTLAGVEPDPLMSATDGPGSVVVVSIARDVDDPTRDPTVRVERRRNVEPGTVTEQITLSTATKVPVHAVVRIELASDLAPLEDVRAGRASPVLPAELAGDGSLRWTDDAVTVRVSGDEAGADVGDPNRPALLWDVTVHPGQPVALRWRAEATDAAAVPP